MKNVILTGFMAAGKSSVGQILANELGWDFIDTDAEVQKTTGLSIPEIFREFGEERFRFEESKIVSKLGGVSKTVISTGGGTVLNPDNLAILQEKGSIVHLYIPLNIAVQRAKINQNRPLLGKNPAELERLWLERQDVYMKAALTIDASHKDVSTIAAEIMIWMKGGSIESASKN